MMETWVSELRNMVNTLERLREFIRVSPEEEAAIKTLKKK